MNPTELDERLRASAPEGLSEDATAREAALELVAATRVDALQLGHTRLRRRLVLGIPAAALAIGLLTAGSVVAVQNLMPKIITIPVSYTTDTGKTISCQVTIEGDGDNAADTAAIAEYVRSKDWTGLGQRVYDYALAHPWKPNPGDAWEDANGTMHKGDPPMTAAERDNTTWDDALSVFVFAPLPKGLTDGDYGSGWGSTCEGVLH